MKTFSIHVLHRHDPITVIAEHAVWRDGTLDLIDDDGESMAEFQRSNVVGVVVASDDEDKGVVQ